MTDNELRLLWQCNHPDQYPPFITAFPTHTSFLSSWCTKEKPKCSRRKRFLKRAKQWKEKLVLVEQPEQTGGGGGARRRGEGDPFKQLHGTSIKHSSYNHHTKICEKNPFSFMSLLFGGCKINGGKLEKLNDRLSFQNIFFCKWRCV